MREEREATSETDGRMPVVMKLQMSSVRAFLGPSRRIAMGFGIPIESVES